MVISKSKDYNQVKTVREWLNGDETALTSAKDNLMRMVNTVTELNNRRKEAGLEPVKVDVRSMLTEAIAVAIGANNYWYHTYVPGADNLFTATGKEAWFGADTTYEKESMKGWWDDEKVSNGGHYKWFSDQYGKLYAVSPYMFTKTGPNQRQGVGKENVPSFYSGVGLEILGQSNTSHAYSDKNHAIPLYPSEDVTDDAKMRAFMTEENGYYTEERFREIATNWVNKVVPQQLQAELDNAKAAVEAKKAEKAQAEQKLAEINQAIDETVKTISAEQAKIDNATNAINTATSDKATTTQKKTEAEQKLHDLEQMAANATAEAQQLATQISTLESNLATKNNALENAKQALEQFNETNKKFNQLTAEKNALVSDKAAKQEELNKVVAALAENASKLADIQSKISAKNNEISAKNTEISNKDAAIAPVEADKNAKAQLVADQQALVDAQNTLVEQAKQLLETQKNINDRVAAINAELPTLDPTMYDADISTKTTEIATANGVLADKTAAAQAEADKLSKFKSEYEARHSDDYTVVNDLGLHEAEYNTLMSNLEANVNKLAELTNSKTSLEHDSAVVANNISLLNKASEGFKAILANLARIEAEQKQLALEQSTKEAEKKAAEAKKAEEEKKNEEKKSDEKKTNEHKSDEKKTEDMTSTSESEEKKTQGIDPALIAGGTVLAVGGGFIIYLAAKKKRKKKRSKPLN